MDWFLTLLSNHGRPRDFGELRFHGRAAAPAELYVVALDCSGSTLRGRRLGEAKGVVVNLLASLYRLRARIGVVTFRGAGAELSFSGRRAPKHTEVLVRSMAGGGGTPLRAGIVEVKRLLSRERKRFPAQRQRVMLFTDGRSRESLKGVALGCPCVLVDMETGPVKLGRTVTLARALGADYIQMDGLPAVSGARARHRRTP